MDFLGIWLLHMMMHRLFCTTVQRWNKEPIKGYSKGIIEYLQFFCIICLYYLLNKFVKTKGLIARLVGELVD